MSRRKKNTDLNSVRSGRAQGVLARIHIDLPLLTGLLLLLGFGLTVLYSASGTELEMVERQAIRMALGLGLLLVLAQIPPNRYRLWSPWFYAAGIGALVAVLLVGDVGKGAQRWLEIGSFRFQPSELVKLAVPMMIAWFLSEKSLPPRWDRLLVAAILTAIPAALIAKQPDLGTAVLVTSAGLFVLFLAGLHWGLILGLIMAAIPAVWALWEWGMHEYQRNRVLTFLDPERDPLGTGYHIIQSKIAIGSGGLYGKGWLNGTQSQLEFVPERHTDFIFAVISEELGFNGVLLMMILFLFIILRGLYIATQAQDTYSRLLAGSITLVFFVYLFVNTGMVSGLLPVVGVPLPLVSYGGTALVTLLGSFGILMSIHTHRKTLG